MDPSIYRKRWHKVRDGKTNPEELAHLCRQAAFSFIHEYFRSGTYVRDSMSLLRETAFHVREESNAVTSAATHTRQYRYDARKLPCRIILLSRATLGADEAAWQQTAGHLRERDAAYSQRFCERGLYHYEIKYNRFMGVISDYFVNEA
jgi:hypothetical protein